VTINGKDATPHLRDEDVERSVSLVSAVPGVRQALIKIQRALARDGAVMAGRDIGSVVLPDAELKIYLDASPEERAQRRLAQLKQQGETANYETLVSEMRRRDHLDSTREVAPLQVPAGAVHLMTNGMSMQDVVDRILSLWAER
jgi:CMP/dCMP kinase